MYNCRASQFRLLSILCWTEFFSVDFVDYFCHYLRESVSFCQSQSAVHLFLYVLITSRNHVLFTLRVVDVIRIIRRTMCGAGAKSINSRQCLTNCWLISLSQSALTTPAMYVNAQLPRLTVACVKELITAMLKLYWDLSEVLVSVNVNVKSGQMQWADM